MPPSESDVFDKAQEMWYDSHDVESCGSPKPVVAQADRKEVLKPLNQREVEQLILCLLSLRVGASMVEWPKGIPGDFRPSSDKAAFEIMGTLAMRCEECRKKFEPDQDVPVIERVLTLEQYERDCAREEHDAMRAGDEAIQSEMRGDRESTGRLVARLRSSEPFKASVLLLSFTLAQACTEDWRMKKMLEVA
jgi:hypothetical protein